MRPTFESLQGPVEAPGDRPLSTVVLSPGREAARQAAALRGGEFVLRSPLNLPALMILLVLGAPGGVAARGAEPQRVLLIHSFGREFAPFDAFSAGFRAELVRQSSGPVDIYEVSLESARFRDPAQEAPFLDYLLALFTQRGPDLVVPIGGPAARFAQRHRPRLFPEVPLLLAATDERHLEAGPVSTRCTTVAVANRPAGILDTILAVLPQTTNVAVVIGSSPLEQFWLGELRDSFGPYTNRIRFDWLNGLSFAQMQQHCATLPPRSAVFFAVLAVDAEGVPYLEQRSLTRLREVANAPLFGLHDTQLGRGIVGGPLMEIEELSRTAARVAVCLLQGENPDTLRVPPQEPGQPQFDWRELHRWGIPEARLPAGSLIRFRQPTAWELYRWRIIAVMSLCLVQALLIVLLVVHRSRRRRAEQSLRESEERLSLAAAGGDLGIWMWDLTHNGVWATANWRRLFGFSPDAKLCYAAVIERIHPHDRDAVEQAVRRAVAVQTDYVGEYRVLLPDGTQRWIAARGRPHPAGGAGQGARMLGAAVDITERRRAEEEARDLSRRLISAQEVERARLARELHDDITQRLARLAIDIASCEHGTSGVGPAETARMVREGLVRLSDDVHALSYRLHPSVLEDLGLAAALKAETERFTRQEGLPVGLRLREVPDDIPHDVALCLFRVAQEALRNAARHARAGRVEVEVRPLDGGLQLAVFDDGCGFHPSLERDRPSLGLASMRERVGLLGGEVEIDSAPGSGTTVLAWVPLAPKTR